MALANTLMPDTLSTDSLTKFLHDIRKFPLLGEKEEYQLAKQWIEKRDPNAAKQLITSHLRLVAKIAAGYRGYGLPMSELVSEGTMGLMHAVKRFDPNKGARLSTYAIWWIRASIQEYVLKSWSLVKITATNAQKKLFFNLRRLKNSLQAYDDNDLKPSDIKSIASTLDVPESDVIDMNRRLQASDSSLNAPISSSPDDGLQEWQDWLMDEQDNQEQSLASAQEHDIRWSMLQEGIKKLNQREREILDARHLTDPPKTLDELGHLHGVSKERIRQIEVKALSKLQADIHSQTLQLGYDK